MKTLPNKLRKNKTSQLNVTHIIMKSFRNYSKQQSNNNNQWFRYKKRLQIWQSSSQSTEQIQFRIKKHTTI